MENVKSVNKYHFGGGIMADLLELPDGRILAIGPDFVTVFSSFEAMDAGEDLGLTLMTWTG